jgi:hypothetical protein
MPRLYEITELDRLRRARWIPRPFHRAEILGGDAYQGAGGGCLREVRQEIIESALRA